MDKNLKILAQKRISKTLEITTISKQQKIEIFQNQENILLAECRQMTLAIQDKNIEIRLLQKEKRKLSNIGWAKFQS